MSKVDQKMSKRKSIDFEEHQQRKGVKLEGLSKAESIRKLRKLKRSEHLNAPDKDYTE